MYYSEFHYKNILSISRVICTAVLGDRHPSELHFFRNYDPPGIDYIEQRSNSTYEPCPRPNGVYPFFAMVQMIIIFQAFKIQNVFIVTQVYKYINMVMETPIKIISDRWHESHLKYFVVFNLG